MLNKQEDNVTNYSIQNDTVGHIFTLFQWFQDIMKHKVRVKYLNRSINIGGEDNISLWVD